MSRFVRRLKHMCEKDKMNVMNGLLLSDLYDRIRGNMRCAVIEIRLQAFVRLLGRL